MATIAVFLAVGGGAAYATHLVVRTGDIVDNEVRTADVRNDSLTGGGLTASDLRAGSVGSSELLDGAVTTGKLANGAVTPNKVAGCFIGFVGHAGMCFERAARSAQTWFLASETCGDAGGRLPLASELRSVRRVPGVDLAGSELSSNIGYPEATSNGPLVVRVNDSGVLSSVSTQTATTFRCVRPRL